MRFLPILFLVFIGGEIAAFIIVGQRLGVVLTLLLLLASFIAGTALILSTGQNFGQVMARRPQTAEDFSALATSVTFRMLAGLLLVVPGFLTDVLALVLLIPAVQNHLRAGIGGSFTHVRAEWPGNGTQRGPVIEGEAIEIHGELHNDSDKKPDA